MMIDKRLINLISDSKKNVVINVLLQWLGLGASIGMVFTLAEYLNSLLIENSNHKIIFIVALLLIFAIVRFICVKGSSKASFYASKSVKKTLREKLMFKLLKLGASYSQNVSTAEVVQLAGEGVEQLETYFGSYLPQFFYSLLAPVTLFIVLSPISLKAAIVLLIFVPLIPVSIIIVQKFAKRLLNKYWGQYTALGDNFLENLQGLTTLKIYQADESKHQKMNQEAEHFRKVTMKVLTMQLNSIIVMDIVAYGGAALGIILALSEYGSGQIDFAGCLCIILLSAEFFLPMRTLGSFFHVAMNGMAASDKIFKLFELSEKKETKERLESINTIKCSELRFGYEKNKEILHGMNLLFNRGSFTALVGESGCGKSTIAALLTGRKTNYSGHILINNKELSDISETDLMKHITFVSHKSVLFSGTVKENLMLAKEDASESEMWQILEQVKIADFLRSEKGLETVLLEGASNLSGGQKQRLALARAILHDSDVYIFDEATSNIDVESENDIMELIIQMTKTKTVILISHRLANVTAADCIYVLEKGNLVQRGTHEQLLSEEGVYQHLWKGQKELEQFGKEA